MTPEKIAEIKDRAASEINGVSFTYVKELHAFDDTLKFDETIDRCIELASESERERITQGLPSDASIEFFAMSDNVGGSKYYRNHNIKSFHDRVARAQMGAKWMREHVSKVLDEKPGINEFLSPEPPKTNN